MDVSYRLRDKFVRLKPISSLLAVRPRGSVPQDVVSAVSSIGVQYWPRWEESIIPIDEMKSFEAAGWLFWRIEGMTLSEAIQRLTESGVYVGRLYLNEDGHLLITTHRLTIKLLDNLTDGEIDRLFKQYVLTLIRTLHFSPNCFIVEIEESQDTLNVALQLDNHPDIITTEPQMLEPISAR